MFDLCSVKLFEIKPKYLKLKLARGRSMFISTPPRTHSSMGTRANKVCRGIDRDGPNIRYPGRHIARYIYIYLYIYISH